MSEVKVLTDIEISQCPDWSRNTDHLFQDSSDSGKSDAQLSPAKAFAKLLKKERNYDVVVTADLKTAQLYGLYRTFLRRRSPRHVILELMLDEPREDLRWRLKNRLQKWCFSSVDAIFVSARREIATYAERLGLPQQRFRFLPFHTNIVKPERIEGLGGYALSAGKTGRDFASLAAAVAGLKMPVVVVSDRHHIEGIDFPEQVEVLCDIPYEKYLELLRGCSLVIVPLKKLIKSTGQVVFLEAMALGKPIIATAATGTEDYIEDRLTGWLVPPEDPEALRAAINAYLDNPGSFSAMAERALEQVLKRHTFRAYTGAILETAESLCTADQNESVDSNRGCYDG